LRSFAPLSSVVASAPLSSAGSTRSGAACGSVLALAKIRQTTGSNQPVLGIDATSATGRRILGVPLYVSPYVAANTLWAIDASRVWLVVRDDAAVEADRSVFFTSDRVAVKATMRAAFGFVHPQALVKVGVA